MNEREFNIAVRKLQIIRQRMKLGWYKEVDEDLRELEEFLAKYGYRLEHHPKYIYTIKKL